MFEHVKSKKSAFTLAEILITLGVIGVVAAIILPSAIINYKNQRTVAQLKKSYSLIEQTIKMAENDYGEANSWNWSDAEIILDKYFIPYIKGTKKFGKSISWNKAICYERNGIQHTDSTYGKVQYTWLSGIHISNPFYAGQTASIQLHDGSCIAINPQFKNSKYNELFSRMIFIDVNGAYKGPNVAGRDLFFFYINTNGVVKPYGKLYF